MTTEDRSYDALGERKPSARRPGDQIELVIVDEHPVVRAGVRTLLENEADVAVVAEASTVDEAVDICRRSRPDVVLFDVDAGAAATVEQMRRLRDECGDGALVVLGRHDDDEDVFRAVLGGAAGLVGENAQPAELLDTIRQAAVGGEPIRRTLRARPAVGRRVLEAYAELSRSGRPRPEPPLSERELRILEHAAQGLTNQQIGHRLGVSEHTVKSDISQLLGRLDLRHRTEAVVHALRHGWIAGPEARHGRRDN